MKSKLLVVGLGINRGKKTIPPSKELKNKVSIRIQEIEAKVLRIGSV